LEKRYYDPGIVAPQTQITSSHDQSGMSALG
jgi:hypothetical protein